MTWMWMGLGRGWAEAGLRFGLRLIRSLRQGQGQNRSQRQHQHQRHRTGVSDPHRPRSWLRSSWGRLRRQSLLPRRWGWGLWWRSRGGIVSRSILLLRAKRSPDFWRVQVKSAPCAREGWDVQFWVARWAEAALYGGGDRCAGGVCEAGAGVVCNPGAGGGRVEGVEVVAGEEGFGEGVEVEV